MVFKMVIFRFLVYVSFGTYPPKYPSQCPLVPVAFFQCLNQIKKTKYVNKKNFLAGLVFSEKRIRKALIYSLKKYFDS